MKNANVVQVRTGLNRDPSELNLKEACICASEARQQKFKGDLMNRRDLVRMAEDAKERLIEKLRMDYGDYFEPIFVGPGKSFSPMSKQSEERLKRKLMIKVLQMQIKVEQACDCEKAKQPDTTYGKYVWATGGHSAAAGHGNLFNESYTAHLTRDARIVFEAIGLEFEGRNYGMGGTRSGPEISMCWQQIFGLDVDFVSWDYALTDLKDTNKILHFGYRGGISQGRPALLAMRIGGRRHDGWQKMLQTLDEIGMSVFVGTDESYDLRKDGLPNSDGLTRAEIDALPYYVRNLKCGDVLEKGDPFCGEEKYTKGACSLRPRQVSWHPGL